MKQISLNNFRKFTSLPPTDLGKLTIMTGGNNSGKSTVDKAIMLILNYLKKQRINKNMISSSFDFLTFNFDISQVHISSFKRALNNTCKPDSDIIFKIVIKEFAFEIHVKSLSSWNNSYGQVSELTIIDQERNIEFKYNMTSMSICFLAQNTNEDISKENALEEEIAKLESSIKDSNDLDFIAKTNNTLELMRSNLKNLTPQLSNNHFKFPLRIVDEDNSLMIPSLITTFVNISKTKETDPQEEKRLRPSKEYILSKEKDIIGSMVSLRLLLSSLNYEYISAYTPSQNSIVTIYDSSDNYAQTIRQFYNSGICEPTDDGYLEITNSEGVNHSDIEKFLLSQMELLNIGKGLRVKSFNNESYTVDIIDDNSKVVPLADKGMGSIHLMALLMKLVSLMKRYEYSSIKPIIIIEEPEQNLHPKVQSLLADAFYSLSHENEFHIILETHSEYLVRKMQVIYARSIKDKEIDEELLNSSIKVYFFPDNDLPYSMDFRSNGRFERSFGPGFFDEAGKWNKELNSIERG